MRRQPGQRSGWDRRFTIRLWLHPLLLVAAAAIPLVSGTTVGAAVQEQSVAPEVPDPPAQPQLPPREPPPRDGDAAGEPEDLTQLSLEQLLELEITPINVLGSHTHLSGEWMVGYHYMLMEMDGERSGTRRVSHQETLQQYPVAHTAMTMSMHMLELMHAPNDTLTLMAMLPYKRMSMDHLNRAGVRYRTESNGIGDLVLMGLYTVKGNPRQKGNRFLLNAGLSVPTGSTSKRDDTPSQQNAKLEYAMQLGSGTWDLVPGITYLGESEHWAWGAQGLATLRLGENDSGYRFGNEFRLTGWGTYRVNDWFAPSVRLDWRRWGNIHGRDPDLDPALNPAFDPRKQKGRRLDLFVGAMLYAPEGSLKGHRLTIEAGTPLYQSLAGPQLETDWQWSLAWTYVLTR